MASRLVPDFPAVSVALEHVQELDKELAFSPDASAHLAEITRAVTGLEAERHAAHEHLEVATIENGKLRHEMNNTRDHMSQVIVTDVAAARASNAEEIEQLRQDLHNVTEIQETTVKKHEMVKSESESLSVEGETVRAQHDKVIAALNGEIMQKYTLQSQLDTTRENVEDLKASIASSERNTLTLQRDLAVEREAFVHFRDDLSKEFEENEERIERQKRAILRSRRELELLNESTRAGSDGLDELRFQTIQLESSVQRLQASKSQCEKFVETEKEKYQKLAAQKEALEKQLDEMIKAFSTALAALREKLATIEEQMVGARATKSYLQDAFAKVYEVFKVHDEEETELRTEYDYVSDLMEKSRKQLQQRVASIVRHEKEMNEMERQTEELKETGLMNKRVFERAQEELCDNINMQTQTTYSLEDEKKQLQKNLKEMNATQEEYVKKMTANIKAIWRKVKDLRTEEATLKQKQPLAPHEIKQYIEKTKAEYVLIESLCRDKITQCTTEIEIVMKKCEDKQKELTEKEQILEDVEAEWKEEESRFEQLKQQEADFKKKRCDLGESIEMLRDETAKLLEPIDEKKAELESIRAEHMNQLRQRVTEMKSVEMCIYHRSIKLNKVQVENSRLHLRIRQMTEDTNNAKEDEGRYKEQTERLQKESKLLFRSLWQVWSEELVLTQERHRVDEALAVPMDALQSHLRTRGRQLGHIQALLHKQMLDFSRRLGDKITVEPQS
ncbi:uncharacterized protein ccdc175 [Eucyclogobius newberryi]|uniref:uncharacterized protein ccdc175 n=1 Tax=Eucyclogobius newberryi TaxID=166745 RepID=UPI003B5B9F72